MHLPKGGASQALTSQSPNKQVALHARLDPTVMNQTVFQLLQPIHVQKVSSALQAALISVLTSAQQVTTMILNQERHRVVGASNAQLVSDVTDQQ